MGAGREETGVEEGDLSGFREEGDKRGRGRTREGEGRQRFNRRDSRRAE